MQATIIAKEWMDQPELERREGVDRDTIQRGLRQYIAWASDYIQTEEYFLDSENGHDVEQDITNSLFNVKRQMKMKFL